MRPTTVLDRMRSTSRNHTIYTAVAPKAVFTMRTLATRATPAPDFSAQIPAAETEKQKVNPLRLPRTPNRGPSQVYACYAGWMNEDNALGMDQAVAYFRAMKERIPVEHYTMMRPPGLPSARFVEYAQLFADKVIPAVN